MKDSFTEPSTPSVSVIVVNFNGKEYLEDCFSSLLNLDFPGEKLEFIMVDNASRDGSVEFLEMKFPWVKVLSNRSNLGYAKAVNQGVRAAKGDYVAILNNDTRADSKWLTQLLLPVLSQSDVACVASKILSWDGKRIDFVGGTLSFYGHGFKVDIGSEDFKKYDMERPILFPCGGAMLADRKVFLEVGGFDEDYFAFFEDVDFGWRLWVLGHKVVFAPRSIVYHRYHSTTAKFGYEKERFLLERNALYTIFKNYGDEHFQRILPMAVLLALQRGLIDCSISVESYRIGDAISASENDEEKISRMTASHLLAIKEFLSYLSPMMKKRRTIQEKRRRSDNAIINMFGEPFRANIHDRQYIDVQNTLVDALNIKELFSRRNKVLIISNDTIGERMAGPAIRCWEFARVLGRENEVILATPNETDLSASEFKLRQYNARVLKDLVRWCDVFVCQGFILHHFPFLKEQGKPIVVDVYDPFTLEFLELFKYKEFHEREALNTANLEVLNDQLLSGDFFICASEKQRDYWIGMLCSLNRINPSTYDMDKTLREFIEVVPFGLPSRTPVHSKQVLKGVHPKIKKNDKLILWGGGIYNWFDPITLIKSMEHVVKKRKDIKLYFMGLKHPNPHVPEMKMCVDAIKLSEELGLKDEYVFFNYDWVPYEERENYLVEADIGISTHLDHVETNFSFRTRLLDYLWASLPIITTRGDSMSDLVEKYDLGITVSPESVGELKAAILKLVDSPKMREIKENIKKVVPRFTWEEAVKPLSRFCQSPVIAPDKIRKRESKRKFEVAEIRRTPWYYFRRLIFHFRNEGWQGVSLHGRNLIYRKLKGRLES